MTEVGEELKRICGAVDVFTKPTTNSITGGKWIVAVPSAAEASRLQSLYDAQQTAVEFELNRPLLAGLDRPNTKWRRGYLSTTHLQP